MASDFDVVRRVSENDRRSALAHEAAHELGFLRIATGDHVVSETPHITFGEDLGLARGLPVFRQHLFDDVRGRLLDIERHIDSDGVKACQLEVKAEFKKLTKFGPELALVPLHFFDNAVERQPKRADLGASPIMHDDHRHILGPELFERVNHGVAVDDLIGFVDQYRERLSEASQERGQLAALLAVVNAESLWIGLQLRNRNTLDFHVVTHYLFPNSPRAAPS